MNGRGQVSTGLAEILRPQTTADFRSTGSRLGVTLSLVTPQSSVRWPEQQSGLARGRCRHIWQRETPSRSEIVDDHCSVDCARRQFRPVKNSPYRKVLANTSSRMRRNLRKALGV